MEDDLNYFCKREDNLKHFCKSNNFVNERQPKEGRRPKIFACHNHAQCFLGQTVVSSGLKKVY
jgi:hypothetical protein